MRHIGKFIPGWRGERFSSVSDRRLGRDGLVWIGGGARGQHREAEKCEKELRHGFERVNSGVPRLLLDHD